MSQPGWYPDPTGSPGQFRYWDGSTWSSETTTTPGAPPGSTPAPPGSSRSGRVVVALAVVAMLVIALVVWRANSPGGAAGPWGGAGDTNSSTPTISAWDETSTATPSTPPENDKGATQVACPEAMSQRGVGIVDGRLKSGNISAPALSGWRNRAFSLQGVADPVAQLKTITWRWMSVSAVGAASKSLGFTSVRYTAEALTDCFASSGYYEGFTGRKTITSEQVTIDGAPAYRIRTEVYVDGFGSKIPGDVIDVIAIDTGNADTFGVYLCSATIGDAETQAQVDSVIADIRVNR